MTLIELLFFIANCIIGVILAAAVHAKTGNLWLAVLSGAVGFGIGVVVCLAVSRALDFWYWLFPLRPNCKQGTCGAKDYRWDIELSRTTKGDVFICHCGDKYIRNHGRFDELLPDGSTKPYMRRSFLFRAWRCAETFPKTDY